MKERRVPSIMPSPTHFTTVFHMGTNHSVKNIPTFKPQQPKNGSTFLLFGTLGTIAVLLAFFWLTRQTAWLPDPVQNILFGNADDSRIFAASVDLNRENARELYRKALTDLQESSYEEAISKFKRLEGVYPGLQDLLWLHEAEAYAGQGNEWAVQKKLNSLLEKQADSPLKALALYRIGQSQYRGSEWEAAEKSFNDIRQNYPKSTYAIGSLYYQGALWAKNPNTKTKAAEPLKSYLSECPDCKFSGEAAELLGKVVPQPSPEEYGLMGVAEAASAKDIKKTLAHLEKGPIATTWLTLGKMQIQAEQTPKGIQTLARNLPQAKNLEEARTAIDTVLAHSASADDKKALLATLTTQPLTFGGDYILWKLAELDTEQAAAHYRQLLQRYPSSDYAPESGWQLLWPLLNNGQNTTFIQQGQQYLSRYPYSKAAPKVLFWIAKLQEKSSPAESTRAYQNLVQQYPTNYYAFRAKGRLKILTEGKADPGWPTLASRPDYGNIHLDLNTLDILPPAEKFGAGDLGWHRRGAAKELQRIGAAEDLRLLATETMGTIPPTIESWAAQVSGDRAKGLRAIRDGLDKQVKDSFINSGGKSIQPAGTRDELKLLYPVYFSDIISGVGSKNRLDPFLIQALMREESYFNEFAISGSNARGLMQLLPSTAKEVAGWEGMPSFQTGDLFSPAVNIRLGSRYLSHLHELFNGNSMPSVGAYNGGPNAMKRWVQGSTSFASDPDLFVERIPYEQSRDYIKKVFTSYWNYSRLYSTSTL